MWSFALVHVKCRTTVSFHRTLVIYSIGNQNFRFLFLLRLRRSSNMFIRSKRVIFKIACTCSQLSVIGDSLAISLLFISLSCFCCLVFMKSSLISKDFISGPRVSSVFDVSRSKLVLVLYKIAVVIFDIKLKVFTEVDIIISIQIESEVYRCTTIHCQGILLMKQ